MKHTEEWHRVGKAFKKTLYYLCAYTCEAFFMKYWEKKYKGVVSKISKTIQEKVSYLITTQLLKMHSGFSNDIWVKLIRPAIFYP